ncbi:hypothetical protein NFJ01_04115 [Lelliottia amnigena]|uniref:hypothetical protein n=1 Tax=Lelliottia amnigena TaxID=61646 RepID=UPI00208FFE94|nr:hypothetical protein [Lelliottia amnigena]USR61580.1 hypothetical protein NFJ01_04115 [Lelliottia amnigena]
MMMELVDLLVQVLPTRGGWPAKQGYAWQDKDGEIRFGTTTEDDFYPNDIILCTKRRMPGYLFVKESDDIVVTRSQYESSIAAGKVPGIRID